MTRHHYNHIKPMIFSMALLLITCAEPGKSGDEGLDCGTHGSAHDGHCHCDDGYLFDGHTCVLPSQITTRCNVPADGGAATDIDEEEDHFACRCPDDGACECHGDLVTVGEARYCAPELHHD